MDHLVETHPIGRIVRGLFNFRLVWLTLEIGVLALGKVRSHRGARRFIGLFMPIGEQAIDAVTENGQRRGVAAMYGRFLFSTHRVVNDVTCALFGIQLPGLGSTDFGWRYRCWLGLSVSDAQSFLASEIGSGRSLTLGSARPVTDVQGDLTAFGGVFHPRLDLGRADTEAFADFGNHHGAAQCAFTLLVVRGTHLFRRDLASGLLLASALFLLDGRRLGG